MMIEVLVGMIASGKTQYAKARAKQGWLVICHDDLTAMLHAEYRYEQDLRSMYREMEEKLAACALSYKGKNVVIDRTHLTRESRARWVEFGKDRGQEVIAVQFFLSSAEVHAARRFRHDDRGRTYGEWLNVANHHYAQAKAEPLDWEAEGFANCMVPYLE